MRIPGKDARTALVLIVGIAASSCRSGDASTPPAPSRIAVVEGDLQVAGPGASLVVEPRVRVTDGSGASVGGVQVTFSVASGGGAVQASTAVTDASGKASCGSWTLGAALGPQTLSAAVDGVGTVTFTAAAARASNDITVSIRSPASNAVVGRTVLVTADVQSTYQVSAVAATLGGQSSPLAYGEGGPWSAQLSSEGVAAGIRPILVSVTDVHQNVADAVVFVRLDQEPTVIVTSPLEGAIAHPTLEIAATCTDSASAPCTSLDVVAERDPGAPISEVLLSEAGAVSGTLDLSAYEGKAIQLRFEGMDAWGQRMSESRTVYVESSPQLVPVATPSSPDAATYGLPRILDVSATRVLYEVPEAPPGGALRILDTATGDVDTLTGTSGPSFGYLTPTGAIYELADGSDTSVEEWREGVQHLGRASGTSLEVAGRYALFRDDALAAPGLILRDLDAGTNTAVGALLDPVGALLDPISVMSTAETAVAENGDVIYGYRGLALRTCGLLRWRSSEGLTILASGFGSLVSGCPEGIVTDGERAAYRTYPPGSCSIGFTDGSTKTTLSTDMPNSAVSYAIAAGHLAYVKVDALGAPQVWDHTSEGERQISFFSKASAVDGLLADGTVLFSSGGSRYLAVPGAEPVRVGGAMGKILTRGGEFYEVLGSTVFRIGR